MNARRLGRIIAMQTLFEIDAVGRDGTGAAQSTHVNREALAGVRRGESEQFSFKGASGATVWGWITRPAGREAGRVRSAGRRVVAGQRLRVDPALARQTEPHAAQAVGKVDEFRDELDPRLQRRRVIEDRLDAGREPWPRHFLLRVILQSDIDRHGFRLAAVDDENRVAEIGLEDGSSRREDGVRLARLHEGDVRDHAAAQREIGVRDADAGDVCERAGLGLGARGLRPLTPW